MLQTKPTLLVLAWLLLPLGITHAQTEKTRGRWEIGVDALSLIEKNEYPPISIFALKKIGSNGFALRGRFGYAWSSFVNQTAAPGTFPIPDDKTTREVFGLVGIQKTIVPDLGVGNGSQLYAGLDFSIGSRTEFLEVLTFELNQFNYLESTNKFLTFAGSPFLGVEKQLGRHFSMRAEMAILFQRKKFDHHSELFISQEFDSSMPFDVDFFYNIGPSGIGYGANQTTVFQTSPLNQLIFTYSF